MRCAAVAAIAGTAACLARPTASSAPACLGIAAGHTRSCAIDAKGEVWCWGRGVLGMANGHGLADTFVTPTQVVLPPGDPAVQIATGDGFTCARVASGHVYCWGEGGLGQLGDGLQQPEGVVQVQLGAETAIDLAAGGQFACIRRASDQGVMCWGANDCNQVSPVSAGAIAQPSAIAGSTGAVAIGLGHRSACWIAGDGSLQCWGKNKHGALGDPDTAPLRRTDPMPTLGFDPLQAIAPGGQFTCALEQSSGGVRCIGDNGYLALGMTTTQEVNPSPPVVPVVSDAVAVSSGGSTACALGRDGSVQCWGRDSHGEVGNGTMQLRALPAIVARGAGAISVGARHACAIVGGHVECWGSNLYGELGTGARAVAISPTPVPPLHGAVALALGSEHSCAIVSTTLYCWGRNEAGELGAGYPISSAMPQPVSSGVYKAVAVGKFSTCAIHNAGFVSCWGRGDYGQLGNSDGQNHDMPVQVGGLAAVSAITVGSLHACAINNGVVVCWGHNVNGELGVQGGDSSTPVAVGTPGMIGAISAGEHHTCAIDNTGGVWCWGLGDHGQLGNGSTSSSANPIMVGGITASRISAGALHTCAISGVNIVCWGDNTYGELGIGTFSPMAAPGAPVMGLTGETPVDVHAMGFSTCALMMSGRVFCWGEGYDGELGDGVANRESPSAVLVPGLTNATALSAAGTSACAELGDGTVQCWGADDWGQLGVGLAAPGASPGVVQGLDCGGS